MGRTFTISDEVSRQRIHYMDWLKVLLVYGTLRHVAEPQPAMSHA